MSPTVADRGGFDAEKEAAEASAVCEHDLSACQICVASALQRAYVAGNSRAGFTPDQVATMCEAARENGYAAGVEAAANIVKKQAEGPANTNWQEWSLRKALEEIRALLPKPEKE